MKKIIMFLAIIIFIPKVHAAEYFWTDQKLDGKEPQEEEKRYLYYQEEKEGEYIKKGVLSDNYEFEDINDIKYGNESSFKDSCTLADGIDIQYQKVYPYYEIPKVKYFMLSNIPRDLMITKIDIYSKDQKISYDIKRCDKCDNLTVYAGGGLLLTFDEEMVIGDLKIDIEVLNDNRFAYTSYFYSSDMLLIKVNTFTTYKNTYFINDYDYLINNFKEIKYSKEEVIKDYTKYPLEVKEMCTEREIQTFRYNIVKKYYDENYYVTSPNSNYIKDENNYHIFYKYIKDDSSYAPLYNSNEISYSNFEESIITPVNTGYNGKNNNYKLFFIILNTSIIFVIFLFWKLKSKKMST